MKSYFENKTAWITGASSGIGEALTKTLNAYGTNVIISARRKAELDRVKSACEFPDKVHCIVLDLEKEESIHHAVTQVESLGVTIDLLFNNGGVSQRSYAEDTPLEVDRRIMEINFFGNIALTKSVLPGMIAQKSGQIIVTSSVAGKYGFFQRTAYAASKHALHGFYEGLRLEQKDNNITVTVVCPGPVSTNMSTNALTSSGEKHGKEDRMLNQGLTPEQAAHKILAATKKKKEEVYFGGKEIIPIYIKRFIPTLFTGIMHKQKP